MVTSKVVQCKKKNDTREMPESFHYATFKKNKSLEQTLY